MKTSLRKLRGFALHHRHGGAGDRRDLRPLPQPDELARASQDMQEIRDCYDSLLSASAATANSAYEFSESLREMGACLLEKPALNDDEETGKVLLMLGKVQYELQKLVDGYRSYIFQTITVPSESLLNELYTVEEMKSQCDEKRDAYEYMVTRYREKGKGRNCKGESFSLQQLQMAHDEYDEEATLFLFRLKSLKEGQSRSLLTQASRHHAAQSWFFRSAVKSLEAVEPHVMKVAEQQHIDYNFGGLEDDNVDDGNDGYGYDDEGDDDNTNDDGELSFDYGQNDQEGEVSTSRNLMDLDPVDITFPRVETLGTEKEMLDKSSRRSFSYRDEMKNISKSAPLFPGTKVDSAEKLRQMRPSLSRKFNTYVLPTPDDTKNSKSTGSSNPVPPTLNSSVSGRNRSLLHSNPIDPNTYEKVSGGKKLPESTMMKRPSVQRESNSDSISSLLPPLSDGILFSKSEILDAAGSKKLKRYAFSGPISPKASPNQAVPIKHPQLFSGPILQNPMAHSPPKISPKVSPSASPTFVSSPKISELHELPRPPASSSSKLSRPVGLVGYSAPLAPKGHVLASASKPLMSSGASRLLIPSQAINRSFSIPSSGLRAMALNVHKPPQANHKQRTCEDMSSPPLSPISLSTVQPSSTPPETEKLVT